MEQKKKIKISLKITIVLIFIIVVSILLSVYFLVQYISNKMYINKSTIVSSNNEILDTEISDLINVNLEELQKFKDDFIGTNVIIEEEKIQNDNTLSFAYGELSNSKKIEFKQQASANFKLLETYILNNEENVTQTILESLDNKQLYRYQSRVGVVEKTADLEVSNETINKFYVYVLSGMIKNYFKYDEYNIKIEEIIKNSEVDTDIYVVVNNKYLVVFEYDETECYFLIYNGTTYNSDKEELVFEHIGGYNSLKSWYRIETMPTDDKPIIYLYPTQETKVSVKLPLKEQITCSYPKYIDGWDVIAEPSGNLIDLETKRNLYALYYESINTMDFQVSEDGFVVKGEEVAKFLEEKLSILGLTEKEAEEFIVYWLPKLESNKYNYIRFATLDEINENMPLEINPTPDTIIRVLMTFKKLDNPIEIKEQKLVAPKRNGFVVVEWGGTEIE